MNAILDIIVPVFGTVLVGWLIGRTEAADARGPARPDQRHLLRAVPGAAVPLDVEGAGRGAVVRHPVRLLRHRPAALLRSCCPRPRAWACGWATARCSRSAGVFSNGVGIGIPFISYAFGEAGLVPLLMIISINSLILLTLSSFLIEIAPAGRRARAACWASWAAPPSPCSSIRSSRRSSRACRGRSSPPSCRASARRW